MIDHIGKEVVDLLIDKLNYDIEIAEEYLLVAALIGQKW